MTIYRIRTCRKCRHRFASRRQVAFLIDGLLFWFVTFLLVGGVRFLYLEIKQDAVESATVDALFVILEWGVWFLFPLRDGFNGMSLGKRLLGVQAVDRVSLRPIGFKQSYKRNLPLLPCILFPILLVIPGSLLMKGHRWGDKWASTTVIWRRYRFRLPFDQRGLLCQKCGYDLTANTSGRCPECGTPIPKISSDLGFARLTWGDAHAGQLHS
ncbi:MAG: RDD family protein [Planctomycetota bacterium]|nr:RDD family protein [Planctomycetota bacterium]